MAMAMDVWRRIGDKRDKRHSGILVLQQAVVLSGIVLGLLARPPAARAAEATAQVIERDGKKLVQMENPWVRLQINPASGGRVSSFVVKRLNREIVMGADSGLFMDHFYEQNWPGEFLYVPYEFQVLETGPARAAVRLTCLSGDAGGYARPPAVGLAPRAQAAG